MAERNPGRNAFIWLTSYSPLSREAKVGTQVGSLEAVTEAGTLEEYCLQGHTFIHFPNAAQDHLPKYGTAHSGLGLARKCLIDVPTGQSDMSNALAEIPSSQMCQIPTKINHRTSSGCVLCMSIWWQMPFLQTLAIPALCLVGCRALWTFPVEVKTTAVISPPGAKIPPRVLFLSILRVSFSTRKMLLKGVEVGVLSLCTST